MEEAGMSEHAIIRDEVKMRQALRFKLLRLSKWKVKTKTEVAKTESALKARSSYGPFLRFGVDIHSLRSHGFA
jgi:hypothetical protein